jgi:hypothetical protein
MLARYSHIRMEARRKALESIVRKPASAQAQHRPEEQQPVRYAPTSPLTV